MVDTPQYGITYVPSEYAPVPRANLPSLGPVYHPYPHQGFAPGPQQHQMAQHPLLPSPSHLQPQYQIMSATMPYHPSAHHMPGIGGYMQVPMEGYHPSAQKSSMLMGGAPSRPSGEAPVDMKHLPNIKVSHKLAERKRRKEMKELFEGLRKSIPVDKSVKVSKWEVLHRGIKKKEGKATAWLTVSNTSPTHKAIVHIHNVEEQSRKLSESLIEVHKRQNLPPPVIPPLPAFQSTEELPSGRGSVHSNDSEDDMDDLRSTQGASSDAANSAKRQRVFVDGAGTI